MVVWGDIFGIAVMLAAVCVGITWLDWILSNLTDALDDSASDLADSDRSAWGDVVELPKEIRPVRKVGGGGVRSKADGPVTRTTQLNSSSSHFGQGS